VPEKVTHLNVGAPWSVCTSRTIIEHLLRDVERHRTQPLLFFEDGLVIQRGEFLDLCERFAGYLRGRVAPGDRVGVALGNRAEYFIALFAIVANRGIVVSINPQAKEHDAGHVLADSTPILLVVEPDNHDLFATLAKRTASVREVVCLDGAEPRGLLPGGAATPRFDLAHADCRRDDITTVFYTSGTTGAPKGCMVDHAWWLRIVDVDLRMNPTGRERGFCSVPFFYADPAIYLMMKLQIGGALVAMRRFSVSRYWDVVSRFGVTKVHAIASIPVLLVKAPPHPLERQHTVHHATCAAVPANLHRQLVDRFGFPWLDNYGATEAGMMCRVPWQARDEMVGSGSIGVPNPEVELRVVDDEGRDVAPGQSGEALIRGPGMFRGYFNRPDATAEALRDGWYHTGDLVRQDERGFVYFLGRKKDIVRRSGENIAAAEVEAVLRLLPHVKDAAVIPVPDEVRGEEVKAYVLLVDGVTPTELPPEALVRHCAERLAAFKVPRYIEYRTGDFPRTPSMKVEKPALKAEKADLTDGAWDRERHAGGRRA
jgi:crotonobetaine/carnitine-CoA ligase